jgi:hypothetical protein
MISVGQAHRFDVVLGQHSANTVEYNPNKEPHGITSQNMALFIVTAMKTSNLTLAKFVFYIEKNKFNLQLYIYIYIILSENFSIFVYYIMQ